MKFSPTVLAVLVLLPFFAHGFVPNSAVNFTSHLRVGVIGAGMSGGSFSYYLRKAMGPLVDIDVYERNDYIGGRLKHVDVDGVPFDLGGDVWSSVNQYMMELQAELNIPLANNTIPDSQGFGIYVGNGEWLDLFRNTKDEAATAAAISSFSAHLRLNYRKRGETGTFTTINDYLSSTLTPYASTTTQQQFDGLVDQAFLDESVLPLSRTIYDEDLSLNAFAGFAALLSATSPTFTTQGGNDVFVQTLLNAANASVKLSSQVTEVEKKNDGTYDLTYRQTTDDVTSHITATYDVVVLAAPIEFAALTIKGADLPEIPYRKYKYWFVTLVSANGTNPEYFHRTPSPDNIYTTHNSSVSFVVDAIEGDAGGYKVYKLFSNGDIRTQVSQLFVNVQEVIVQYWPYTFPALSPDNTQNAQVFQPIILDKNLYSTSGLESVAVAMECSVISGRNIALLIAQSYS